jgi:hypothetical protein
MLVASNVVVNAAGSEIALPSTRSFPALAPAAVASVLTALSVNDLVPSLAVASWIAWTCHLSPAVALSEKVPSAALRAKALPPRSDQTPCR